MLEDIKPFTKSLNILYVEDEPDIREYLVPILEQLFNNVMVAVNGQDGLDQHEEFHTEIDLILTDISMPKLDGLEMSRRIKAKKKNQHIIILSAHNDTDFLLQAIEVGVEYFILKPIQYDNMFGVIKKLAKRIQDDKELNKHRIDKMLEDAKRATTLMINTVVNSNPIPAVIIDNNNKLISYNLEFFHLLNGIDDDTIISLRDGKIPLDNLFANEDGYVHSDSTTGFLDKLLSISDEDIAKIKFLSDNNTICYVKIKKLDTDELESYYQVCFIEENEYK